MSSEPVYEVVEYATAAPFKAFITGLRAINRHVHEDFEIGYVISGLGRLSLDAEDITLKTEDLFVVNCNTVHAFESDASSPMVALFIQLRPSLLEALNIPIRSLEIRCTPELAQSRRGADALRRLRAGCIAMVRHITSGAGDEGPAVPAHMLSILSLLLRQFPTKKREEPRSVERGRYYDRICRIIRYLNENFAEEVSLAAIADRMNMSVYHLCHIFKKMVGISVGRYLTSVRLEKVKEHLLTCDDSVTTIAMDCGFSNLGYFYKTFHATMGCTPLQYKVQKVQGTETTAPGAAPPALDSFHSAAIGNYLNVNREIIDAQLPRRADHREAQTEAGDRQRPRITSVSVDIHDTAERLPGLPQRIVTLRGLPSDRTPAWRETLAEVHHGIGFAGVRLEVPHRAERAGGEAALARQISAAIKDIHRHAGRPVLRLPAQPSPSPAGRGGAKAPRRDTDAYAGFRRLLSCLATELSREEGRNLSWEISDGPAGCRTPVKPDEYLAWYNEAAPAIRRAFPAARVGGVVATTIGDREQPRLRSFLYSCALRKVPLESVTLQIRLPGAPSEGGISALGDPAALAETLKRSHAALKATAHGRPGLHADLSAAWQGCPQQPRDSAAIVALVVEQYIGCAGLAETFSFAAGLDVAPHRSGHPAPASPAQDLFDVHGAYLPAYHGSWFLARMGEACMDRGPGHLVTRKGRDRVQVLLWNRATQPLTVPASGNEMRGEPAATSDTFVHIEVSGLTGLYKAIEYGFDRRHGSLFDRWVDIGSPATCTPDEMEILREGSHLKRTMYPVQYQGRFARLLNLRPHAVKLIELYPADAGS